MKESIEFPVVLPNNLECDARLCVDTEEGVFDIIVDNNVVCSGAWHDNLGLVLKRALEIWNIHTRD